MAIRINRKIPSTMSRTGIEYLGEMAKTVPPNGIIVEIGPLFGSSTWVMAKNAHPSVKIYSIDTWEPDQWIEKINKRFKGSIPFSKEAFLEYTKDCPNVIAIQGWSPEIVKDWNQPIDMYFDDATHGNPGFRENLDFFLPFIKEDGIVCGDDYAYRWPDIVREVDEKGDEWGVKPEIKGRVWSLSKPVNGETPPFINRRIDNGNSPAVVVNVSTFKKGKYVLPPDVWVGSVHKPDPVSEISIEWAKPVKGLDIEWRLLLQDGTETEWMRSGDHYTVEHDNLINGLRARLTGTRALLYSVEYQLGFCWGHEGNKRFNHTTALRNGTLQKAENKKMAVNSLRLSVFPNTRFFGKIVDRLATRLYTQQVD